MPTQNIVGSHAQKQTFIKIITGETVGQKKKYYFFYAPNERIRIRRTFCVTTVYKSEREQRKAHERSRPSPHTAESYNNRAGRRQSVLGIAKVWKITDKVPLLSYTSRFWLEILNLCVHSLSLVAVRAAHTFLCLSGEPLYFRRAVRIVAISHFAFCLHFCWSYRNDSMAFHSVSRHIYSCSATCDLCVCCVFACAFIFRVTLWCAYIRFGNSYLAFLFFYCASVFCAVRRTSRTIIFTIHSTYNMQTLDTPIFVLGIGGKGEVELHENLVGGRNLHYFHDYMQLIRP